MKVLFVCVENAGRSQIAQALYERRGGEARSAGSKPAAELHEAVVEALEEIEIDVSGRKPKALEREDVEWADLVVTMGCGDACPVIPGKRYLDWNLPDDKASTVAGLVIHEAETIPAIGQHFDIHGFRFTVLEKAAMQITRLRIDRLPDTKLPEDVEL